MSTTAVGRAEQQAQPRLHTIGAVCARLQPEFPDISISKIRYLEDQGLLTPKRTRGGYRLFSEEDVERLETILRLQRDEFLPLRVIRQELAAGGGGERKRRRPAALGEAEGELDLQELCERAGIDLALARALEEFGLLVPRLEGGDRLYRESDADVAAACGRLAQYGIDARHLRTTCARFERPPTGRRRCWSSSSRPRCAPATPSGARAGWTTSSRSPRPPRSSRACCSGVSCARSQSGRVRA
jgi:DNA-binding transcriptional MerR regulator